MIVYEAPSFSTEVEEAGISDRVGELTRQIREHARIPIDLAGLLKFIPPYHKKHAGQFQVVGRWENVDGTPVFCFLRVFRFGDDDYLRFLDDADTFGKSHLEPLLDINVLRRWLGQRDDDLPSESWQPLPEELRPWLGPSWSNTFGLDPQSTYLFETRAWVDRSTRPWFINFWQSFHALVQEIVFEEAEVEHVADLPEVFRVAKDTEGRSILHARGEVTATVQGKDVALPTLLLLAPFREPPSTDDVSEVMSEVHPLSNGAGLASLLGEANTAYDDIARLSLRTYPDYIVLDDAAWRRVQANETANLALSSEEHELLSSVIMPKDGTGLPIFINGRAGSGKSTMLMYLFADLCHRKQSGGLVGTPLFLTRNSSLLAVESEGIRELFRAHEARVALTGSGRALTDAGIDQVKEWCWVFDDLVREQLDESVAANFNLDRRVEFGEFKRAYLGGSGKLPIYMAPRSADLTPELCWYVIRTFIKGYLSGEHMDKDGYREVPRRERIVDEDVFDRVFDTVWSTWYQGVGEDGWWDDQDLVAAAIGRSADLTGLSPITAVFCDEAQDFTRQELQFLLRLSVYSRFDLSGTGVSALPFAFAGDPFQTLNPTGFRWSATGRAFHEELISRVGSADLTVRSEELTRNYRSGRSIVGVINGIQLWRRVLLGMKDVRAQEAWQQSGSSPVHKFILGSNLDGEEFADNLGATPLIVPWEEGELFERIRDDDLLSREYPEPSSENPPTNIYAVTQVKGLEFERVILYKFGDSYEGAAWDSPESAPMKEQFFFNKLYVAASRATDRLFVVDTDAGDQRLWSHHSKDELHSLLETLSAEGQSDFDIQHIDAIQVAPPGTGTHLWIADYLRVGNDLFDAAREAEDPILMRQARDNFRRAGKDSIANRAEAWALRFEGRHSIAGGRFLELDEYEWAWETFWEGGCWPDLSVWFDFAPETAVAGHRSDQGVVTFMAAQTPERGAMQAIAETIKDRLGRGLISGPQQRPWGAVVERFVRQVMGELGNLDGNDLDRFGSLLQDLGTRSFPGAYRIAGRCFLKRNMWIQAATCWSNATDLEARDERDLTKARAEVEGMPAGLRVLSALGPGVVVERWNQAGRPRQLEWLEAGLAEALGRLDRSREAWEEYLQVGDVAALTRFFDQTADSVSDQEFEVRLIELCNELTRGGEYSAAISRINTHVKRLTRATIARVLTNLAESPGVSQLDEAEAITLLPLLQIFDRKNRLQVLHPKAAGALYEVLPEPRRATEFYQRYVEDSDPGVREHARARWLASQQKVIKSERTGRGRKEEQERLRQAKAVWEGRIGPTEIQERKSAVLILDTSSAAMINVDFGQNVVKTSDNVLKPRMGSVELDYGEEMRIHCHFKGEPRVEISYRGQTYTFRPQP